MALTKENWPSPFIASSNSEAKIPTRKQKLQHISKQKSNGRGKIYLLLLSMLITIYPAFFWNSSGSLQSIEMKLLDLSSMDAPKATKTTTGAGVTTQPGSRANLSLFPDDVQWYYDNHVVNHCNPNLTRADPGCVYIVINETGQANLVYDNLVPSGKLTRAHVSLLGALKYYRPQQNISFGLDLRASGIKSHVTSKDLETCGPLFAISRFSSSTTHQLLMPNPYFLFPTWWENYTSVMKKLSSKIPWENKIGKVFFRGSCGPGGRERLRLLMLEEERVDAGFHKALGYGSLKECVEDLGKEFKLTEHKIDKYARKTSVVRQSNYANYRYLLHMPGCATGSYSRALQYLFMHGSIVLIWDHDATEFYYRHMQDQKHYMSVNSSNFSMVIDLLDNDKDLQTKLIQGAEEVRTKFISQLALNERWRHIMKPLEGRQPIKMSLENVCSCNDWDHLFECAHCQPAKALLALHNESVLPPIDYGLI